MKKLFAIVLVSVMILSSLTACGSNSNDSNKLYVFNWGEYIEPEVLDIFEEETGIEVIYDEFETNESMYSKISAGASLYDLVCPSDYMISKMIAEDLLQPINWDNIPNRVHIGEEHWEQTIGYDPELQYALPYTWGTVGLIYNYDKLGFDPTSWDILWDELYAGEILMFSNSRDAFGLTLMRLGYDINSQDTDQLDEAADELKAQKPLVQAYVMDQIFDKMQGNEAALAPYYAGDAVNMMAENESLRFVVPEEGSNWFADAACMPKYSNGVDANRYLAAHMYINFLNEPNVAAENIEYIQYSTPNSAAKALLDEETQNNPIIYPDDEVLDNCQAYVNLSTDTNLYMDTLWTDLMSSSPEYNEWAMPLFLMGCLAACVLITVGKKQYRRRKDQFSYDTYRKNIMA